MKSRRSGREVKSPKDLARWSPGVMNMISRALLEQVFEEEVSMKALSWDEHLANNHVPYRKDCLVCQETQQKGMPQMLLGSKIKKKNAKKDRKEKR